MEEPALSFYALHVDSQKKKLLLSFTTFKSIKLTIIIRAPILRLNVFYTFFLLLFK